MDISQRDGLKKMSAQAIRAIRIVAPRHTAKWMSRKWGRAVVTTKQWLKNGVPEYLLQTILADLDEEFERYETELTAERAALRKARHEATTARAGGVAGVGLGQGRALVHQGPSRGREGTDASRSVGAPGGRR